MIKIFFIDDDPITLNMLSKAAEHAGYKVITSVDPRTAIDIASEFQPDVIILDLNMPDMDGLEVLSKIRKNVKTAHIPVVMLTAKGESSMIMRAQELKADDYITKPFDIPEFLATVRRFVV